MQVSNSLTGSNLNPVTLMIDGPPCSGKSTRGEEMATALGFKFSDVGGILRQSEDPDVFEMMRRGEYVPDHLISRLLKQEAYNESSRSGVFVGVKNVNQVHNLFLELCNLQHRIVYLNLTRPKDDCLGLMRSRNRSSGDDREEVFNTRWSLYEEHSPMIENFFRARPTVRCVAYQMSDDPNQDKWNILRMIQPHCGNFTIPEEFVSSTTVAVQ